MWEKRKFSKKLHVDIIQGIGTDRPCKILKETLAMFQLMPLSIKVILISFTFYLPDFYFPEKFRKPKR